MTKIIGGIQQVGIGVPDVQEIFPWYKNVFGCDIKVFDEAAEAPLMTKYTGGEVHSRRAAMALNLQGGGGMEIWQFTSRVTEKPKFDVELGDLGIFVVKMKARSVSELHDELRLSVPEAISELLTDPKKHKHFYVRDPHGNNFEVVEGESFFKDENKPSGGVAGAVMGVSNIEKSIEFYSNVLDYDTVEYDKTGVFEDFKFLPGGDKKVRRVLLTHSKERKGPFSQLLGPSEIELVQLVEGKGRKIFKDRFWGDWGFIHLCMDVSNMDAIAEECAACGCPFTVDSGNTFDMGDAAGRFAYTEDPDGALIEFVEAHKMPIMKKWGWYKDLKKRNPEKPLPRWLINALRFSRVKK